MEQRKQLAPDFQVQQLRLRCQFLGSQNGPGLFLFDEGAADSSEDGVVEFVIGVLLHPGPRKFLDADVVQHRHFDPPREGVIVGELFFAETWKVASHGSLGSIAHVGVDQYLVSDVRQDIFHVWKFRSAKNLVSELPVLVFQFEA